MKLVKGGKPMPTKDDRASLTINAEKMKSGGARIVLVLLLSDCYGLVKLVTDKMGK